MKNQLPLLFSPGPASKPYKSTRDHPNAAKTKAFLEELWIQYCPYADRHFLQEFRQENQFYPRLWELHLGCTLLRRGYDLKKVGNEGPDFCVHVGDKKIWIEAIAPGAGTKKDAVPLLCWKSSAMQDIPEKQILLRFTQAIKEKRKKYTGWIDSKTGKKHKGYLEKGIIHPDDCYIIAIAWNDPNYSRTLIGTDSIPYIIRAVLGYGPEMVSFGKEPDDSFEVLSSYRKKIEKTGGSSVSTNFFRDEKYIGISAIIYSEERLTNFPNIQNPDHLGTSFLYLHNPLAKNKLPRGTFKFCKEYWEERELQFKNWSKEQGENW
jgi:hypothetical protein